MPLDRSREPFASIDASWRSILKAAAAEERRLRRRAERNDARRAVLDAEARSIEAGLVLADRARSIAMEALGIVAGAVPGRRLSIPGREILEKAHAILAEEGSPLVRREIARRIEAESGPTGSHDLVGHLGVLMWGDRDRFVSLGRKGYGLVQWDTEDTRNALARRTR